MEVKCEKHSYVKLTRAKTHDGRPYLKCFECVEARPNLKHPGWIAWAQTQNTIDAYAKRKAEIWNYLVFNNVTPENLKFLLDMYALAKGMSPAQQFKYHMILCPIEGLGGEEPSEI